jgi:5-methylcytosine-specific restriction endonuclease McrA
MASASIKFKKMLCAYDKAARDQILYRLMNWVGLQFTVDPGATACYTFIQEAYQINSWTDTKAFKNHYFWATMANHDTCVSFQEIVKAKLSIPKKNIEIAIKDAKVVGPRKAIPKKIRGEAWKNHFGDSTKGACHCCKKELDVFDDWHAGHIVSHSNGGTDTAQNLRPLCGSCNLSMGTENMDAFKARCYPA